MTVQEILSQITIHEGIVTSKTTGKQYTSQEFIDLVSDRCKLTKAQKKDLQSHFTNFERPQSEESKYIEKIIEKYDFKFSDGVYIVRGKVLTMEEIYRLFWKEEKVLPVDTDKIIENIEKISEPMSLQEEIFSKIKAKAIKGESKYIESLYSLYQGNDFIDWYAILHNILCPNTKPLFHIFYDDGVGGTGKSTFLEVLTKIVGENFTSNVLLDQFGNRFIFANMLGKYLNIGDDNGKNDELQNVGTLKSIITGNRVTIDRKNIAPIEVRIFAKQLFATNILPYIDFTDGGIMRRLNIIPMNKVIPKGNKLPELDEEEIGHIIYNAINYIDIGFPNSDEAITSSPLYRFYTSDIPKSYLDYQVFCENNGFRKMNIINFEAKSKFIENFIKQKEDEEKGINIF